jgi:hypothetical protein
MLNVGMQSRNLEPVIPKFSHLEVRNFRVYRIE